MESQINKGEKTGLNTEELSLEKQQRHEMEESGEETSWRHEGDKRKETEERGKEK